MKGGEEEEEKKKKKNACRLLVEKPEGKRPLGRARRRFKWIVILISCDGVFRYI
jgi:hypothetical protein